MSSLQRMLELDRELNRAMLDWIRHDQMIRSQERWRKAFGYPGEHPDTKTERIYRKEKR